MSLNHAQPVLLQRGLQQNTVMLFVMQKQENTLLADSAGSVFRIGWERLCYAPSVSARTTSTRSTVWLLDTNATGSPSTQAMQVSPS